MAVSLTDYSSLNDHLIDEYLEDVRAIFESGQFAAGSSVQKFEEQMARFNNCKHAVGVKSGTDALVICLNALGIGAGDEVLMPVLAPASLALSVARLGGTPVFVDVRQDSFTMDPDQAIASLSTAKTKAIIVHHTFGLSAEIDRIMTVARTYSVPVIEDVTAAAGGRFHGRRLGSFGNFSCYDFGPSAVLSSAGSAGAIVSNDDNFVEHFRRLRLQGAGASGIEAIGYDAMMDAVQAAFMIRKLAEHDDNNLDRVANARMYSQLFEDSAVVGPPVRDDLSHIYSEYVIQVSDPQALVDHLKEKEIEAAIPSIRPLHLEPAFAYLNYQQGAFPVAEEAAQRLVSIPVTPGLKKSQVNEVASAILAFYGVPA
ncbi:MAG: DegT/DnrJ/EryC1/StrS family aminotransferase [Candidatus Sumerlaeia bacterium]|nr:DegT/DnrJ/EryC1/StrS family aminotransferase [Candidatus Sumerlaeia bacterium]